MDKKYVNAHATPPVENFRYFLSVMAWLAVFFMVFIFLLFIFISILPEDPEWVEYCAEYLSIIAIIIFSILSDDCPVTLPSTFLIDSPLNKQTVQ